MPHENGNGPETSRRAFLHVAGVAVSALSIIGMTSRAEAKASQQSVGYQGSPKGNQNCANCRIFVAPNSCKQVDGVVSPNGWCRIWSKAG
ncbi:High potential iron-sulfur protein [Methylocapsa palsarum]|uniref:High-potential iron-sulfur protein n=2 Tax=Methylocapsa palsarum TaxID=1612308 RepID=A0A1I4D216_9HYPH|nr:High potential iron-sulfur protein [Methylocapsa palsarum]